MKNIIFLFACILMLSFNSKAQGNLQFSRVLLVTSAQTVPANKVWKLESALIANTVGVGAAQTHYQSTGAYFLVNGNAIAAAATYYAAGVPNVGWLAVSIAATQLTVFPIWLPAGNTTAASTNVTYVSVIEFNIVP